jgi:hypothetical protein
MNQKRRKERRAIKRAARWRCHPAPTIHLYFEALNETIAPDRRWFAANFTEPLFNELIEAYQRMKPKGT